MTISKAEWQNVAQNATRSLTKVFPGVMGLHEYRTEDDIRGLVRTLSDRQRSKLSSALVGDISSIVGGTTRLQHGIRVVYQTDNEVAETVWLVLGLVIKLMTRDNELVQLTIDAYHDLLETVPDLPPSLQRISDNIDKSVFLVYQGFVGLGVRAVKAFGRNDTSIGIITKIRWKSDQTSFVRSVEECKYFRRLVEKEISRRYSSGDASAATEQEAALSTFEGIDSASTLDGSTLARPTLNFPLFFIPPPSSNFVARNSQMADLEQKLGINLAGNSDRVRAVAVHGLGGVGKTQLVTEFAYKHRSRYDLCYWISSETPVKLAQGFGDLALKLQIEEADRSQARTKVKEWLCDTGHSWLLIFDNVEKAAQIIDYIPTTSSGTILITTRCRDWIEHGFVNVLNLESFGTEDGVKYLQSIMSRHSQHIDQRDAEEIVEEVGGLPLAIGYIGSFIGTTMQSPRAFLEGYRNREVEASMVNSYVISGADPDTRSLAKVWDITLSKLTPQARFLLNVMAFLDPDDIPSDLLTKSISTPTNQSFPFPTKESYVEARTLLRQYDLVSYNENQFIIHRHLKRVIIDKLSSDEFQATFNWVLMNLRKEFPHRTIYEEPLSRMRRECDRWISHVMSVNTLATIHRSKVEIPEMLADLLVDGAMYLWERGLLEPAEELINSAERIPRHGKDNFQLLGDISCIKGCILSASGKRTKARASFKKQADYKHRHMGQVAESKQQVALQDEIPLANAYNNLAGILCACHEFREAELHNKLSLLLKERWRRSGNLDYLLSLTYNNTANVFGLQEKWDEAGEWFQKALQIPRRKYHLPHIALVYHNFGCMRSNQGQIPDAIKLLTKAVALRTKELGDHYDTANSYHALARCYRKAEKLDEAKDLLNEALRMLNCDHLKDKARIARTKYLLSLILDALGDPTASKVREEARAAKREATKDAYIGSSSSDEDDYDNLVPYL